MNSGCSSLPDPSSSVPTPGRLLFRVERLIRMTQASSLPPCVHSVYNSHLRLLIQLVVPRGKRRSWTAAALSFNIHRLRSPAISFKQEGRRPTCHCPTKRPLPAGQAAGERSRSSAYFRPSPRSYARPCDRAERATCRERLLGLAL